jgi:hypothetical protein
MSVPSRARPVVSAEPSPSVPLPQRRATGEPEFAEPGRPLEPKVRGFMEDRYDSDFSRVRVHTDDRASDSARELGAAAYTYGNDIVFRRQAYDPHTPAGLDLIAHELAHVTQQSRGRGSLGAASEQAAGHAADLALRGAGEPGRAAGATVRGVACESEEELARRRAQIEAELPKGAVYALDPGRLDREYRAALAGARKTGDWRQAAEILNGFDHIEIQTRLAGLSDTEVGLLHMGALGNLKVGPDAQVARLTKPGTPRASTVPPEQVAAGKPAGVPGQGSDRLTDEAVRAMSRTDRLVKAYEFAKIGEAAAKEIAGLVSAKALVLALFTFAATYLALQLTPVGWAANIGIAITAAFVGPVLFRAIKDLVMFVNAANATTVAELEEAGRYLADAIGGVTVQVIVALVMHRTVNTIKGSTPYNGPPPAGFADAVANNGLLIRVPIPAGAAASPATLTTIVAAQLGVKTVPVALAVMNVGGGGGSGAGAGGPQASTPSSGGGSGQGARIPPERQLKSATVPPERQLEPGGTTSKTLSQVQRGTPKDKGTLSEDKGALSKDKGALGEQHEAELQGGSTVKTGTKTSKGMRFQDVVDIPLPNKTTLVIENKNYQRWVSVKDTKEAKELFIDLSTRIVEEMDKDQAWVLAGERIGEHRVAQWNFTNARPNAEFTQALRDRGLPYVEILNMGRRPK